MRSSSAARGRATAGAVVLIAALLASGAAASGQGLALLDLDGGSVDPFETADSAALVFIFVKADCPISNRYTPEIRRLRDEFEPRKVAFWLVYADPDETAEMIREHLKDYGHDVAALRDPEHSLVRLAGATVTPEAAVFTGDRKLAYRGRIDDMYVAFGKRRPAPTVRDLELAVEAVLDGREVENPTTTAVGCFIPPLR